MYVVQPKRETLTYDESDERLRVSLIYCFNFRILDYLQDEFLGYLDEWSKSVQNRVGFTRNEKATMMLSHETIQG